MGRAHCTWQLSTGGSHGHRLSFRMVSSCASFNYFPTDEAIPGLQYSVVLTQSAKEILWELPSSDSSHSRVLSQLEILVICPDTAGYSSSQYWSRWSVVILNMKTRVRWCCLEFVFVFVYQGDKTFFQLFKNWERKFLVVLPWVSWCSQSTNHVFYPTPSSCTCQTIESQSSSLTSQSFTLHCCLH